MDSGKSPGARALLSLARSPARNGENAALGNKDDVSVGKLLLQLTGQPGEEVLVLLSLPEISGENPYLC